MLSSVGTICLGLSQSGILCVTVLSSKLRRVATLLIHIISFFNTCGPENVDREQVVLHTAKVMRGTPVKNKKKCYTMERNGMDGSRIVVILLAVSYSSLFVGD